MKKISFLLVGLLAGFCVENLSAKSDYVMDDSSVNAFDSLFMCPYSETLDKLGTASTIAACCSSLWLLSAPSEDYWKIGIVGSETLLSAYGLNTLFKKTITRDRPYMFFEGAPTDEIESGDSGESFPSRHTTLAFAAAGFTTFMFCNYYSDSKYKIPAIAMSYGFAGLTAALRVSSGNHFTTDVLAGAAIGTACGFLIPLANTLWFKPCNNMDTVVTPMGLNFCFNL